MNNPVYQYQYQYQDVICIPVHSSGRSSWSQPELEILHSSVGERATKCRTKFPHLIIET